MTDRPWPVVTREQMWAAIQELPLLQRVAFDMVFYKDERDGRMVAYVFNDRRFHLRPDLA